MKVPSELFGSNLRREVPLSVVWDSNFSLENIFVRVACPFGDRERVDVTYHYVCSDAFLTGIGPPREDIFRIVKYVPRGSFLTDLFHVLVTALVSSSSGVCCVIGGVAAFKIFREFLSGFGPQCSVPLLNWPLLTA